MLIAILAFTGMQGFGTTQTTQSALSVPARYKVESKTTLDQDLTTLGRGKVTGSMTTMIARNTTGSPRDFAGC